MRTTPLHISSTYASHLLLHISSLYPQENRGEYEQRDRLVEVVKRLAREYKSYGLMQLASAAQNDPFVKVRGLIESMIANLLEQAQQEADHNRWGKCGKCYADEVS